MIWKGFTDEMMTSIILLVFSSITPLITCIPNVRMNISINIEKPNPTPAAILKSALLSSFSPFSPKLEDSSEGC